MKNYEEELKNRIEWIQGLMANAHAEGLIFGNSGGKDSALVGIICKKACENTVGVIMPCAASRNFGEDMKDGLDVAKQFGIETRVVDLTAVRESLLCAVLSNETCESEDERGQLKTQNGAELLTSAAVKNIAPRLRMTTLYAISQSENRLVAGTGNRDELYVGYYTKYGDGGTDFNPIGDLTVGEVYEFLEYLGAPENIRTKAPSAGLEEGQTDEKEMGILYSDLDEFLLTGKTNPQTQEKVERMHRNSEHKRSGTKIYSGK